MARMTTTHRDRSDEGEGATSTAMSTTMGPATATTTATLDDRIVSIDARLDWLSDHWRQMLWQHYYERVTTLRTERSRLLKEKEVGV